jgi:hypothetical protein
MRQLTHALAAALVVVLSAGAVTMDGQQNAGTTNNGHERTPVLGWSTWKRQGKSSRR